MKRASMWILPSLLLLALALRLHGVDWGLPQVYEEATPFKKAWNMWGWGANFELDLNPHFFNYPTLYFYVQFVGQALLYVILFVFRTIGSTLDFRVLYELDKTPFYLMGRSLSILFGVATVWVTYTIGRRVGSRTTGIVAALLVAINHVHIERSQMIEVDVPLTFFVMLTGLYAIKILQEPSLRNYVLAGLFAGLATSTKYSGGLLPVSIFAAHLVVLLRSRPARQPAQKPAAQPARPRRSKVKTQGSHASRQAASATPLIREPRSAETPRQDWTTQTLLYRLGIAAVVCVVAFLVASPFIVIDRKAFWDGFNYERLHMRIGHFGLDDTPALVYYVRVLTGSLLGWPLSILSAVALFYLAFMKRRAWAWVLAIYPIVYVALISSWSMKAERYVLPLMPIACLLASAAALESIRGLRRFRALVPGVVFSALIAVLFLPAAVAYKNSLSRLRPDTRTLALRWIEENAPGGSFIVSEAYGPEPFNALQLAGIQLDVREHITEKYSRTRLFAFNPIPMKQVLSEGIAAFYDLGLWEEADYIVTSSSISSRYRKDPEGFAQMLAFYDELERQYEKVAEFGPQDGSGPTLMIYKNPRQLQPFGSRGTVPSPASRPRPRELLEGTFSRHFHRLAVNLEVFGYHQQAAETYQLALSYPELDPTFRRDQYLGGVRAWLRAGRPNEALALIASAEESTTSERDLASWQRLRTAILESANKPSQAQETPESP